MLLEWLVTTNQPTNQVGFCNASLMSGLWWQARTLKCVGWLWRSFSKSWSLLKATGLAPQLVTEELEVWNQQWTGPTCVRYTLVNYHLCWNSTLVSTSAVLSLGTRRCGEPLPGGKLCCQRPVVTLKWWLLAMVAGWWSWDPVLPGFEIMKAQALNNISEIR